MKRRFICDCEEKLLVYLGGVLAGVPRDRIKIQLKRGEVRLNGAKTRSDIRVAPGDVVEIFLPSKFDTVDVPVIYEDENIMIVDKPPFVESENMLPAIVAVNTGKNTIAVHRLDTNTTGLVILAKNGEIKAEFIEAFRAGLIKKTYCALVFGCPPEGRGRWKDYLIKDPDKAHCTVCSARRDGAKEIITDYEVLTRGERSLLKVCPVTGRTHQLRAHLAYKGYPIVGDGKYGDNSANRSVGADFQKLRATGLEFGKLRGKLEYLSGRIFVAEPEDDIACRKQNGKELN